MEVRAVAKNIRVSPSKARLLVDMVRGKKVEEALTMLRFTPTPTARAVAKVIKSAAANAENGFQMSPEALRIRRVFVDSGLTMKRYRPAARGRASPVLKRSSHITVIVAEQENYGT
ncbi:MAG: 50S ribosomal protein L22 [Chloroflexi bacterium RBG_16_57_8]|nr:MAG: 50S ribosomal protein L22 [Chloroflexi bacterium RBG_16_57_8]